MLDYLRVKNVALIDEVELNFGAGLNILSGETGAGKSIIIDSINFALGGRTARDFIRSGESFAEVTALFGVVDSTVSAELDKLGVDTSDGEVLLYRSVSEAGKSVCKINGKTATAGMLRDVSALLVDVHGQHEHQSLLDPAKHIELLDRFGGAETAAVKAELTKSFRAYKSVVNAIKAIEGDQADGGLSERVQIYEFQISEIEAANLYPEEEEELLSRRKTLSNAEKLSELAAEAATLMNGGKAAGVTDRLWKVYSHIESIAALDDGAAGLLEGLDGLCAQADDLARTISDYYEDIDHDPRELDRVEGRLDEINRLKRKYGADIAAVLDHLTKTRNKLDAINNATEDLERLGKEKAALGKATIALCDRLSQRRVAVGALLRDEITANLQDLGMVSSVFDVSITKKDGFGVNGYDKIEFMIAPNVGEGLKPLSKIASGGEMSRVMLALKAVISSVDVIETFIFDEIDTGVSGRTAQKVAEKLGKLAKEHQLLCITHLPQIAAFGDGNFLIEKTTDEETGRTTTAVNRLDEDGVTNELARLIGGAVITAATTDAAREMRALAKN